MIDEKINCYRTGFNYPEETQIAIRVFESFAEGFKELYAKVEPQDSRIKEIFKDLAEDYTFEFFQRLKL